MGDWVGTHRVEWGETDAAAIVFYPNYFRWFDNATHDLFRAIGLPVDEISRRGYILPIVEAHARFRAPLAYGDDLELWSRVSEVRNRAFRVEHEVRRGGEAVVDGYEVRMWVRSNAGHLEPALIPEEVRRLIEPDGS